MLKPSVLVTAATAALAIALSVSGCWGSDAGASPGPTGGLYVRTKRLQKHRSYEIERVFSGTVRSRRASHLGFERDGLVTEVLVDEGDHVRKDQLIAKLDTAQLRATRRRMVAALANAQAGVGISELTAKRLGQLADEQFVSRQSSDEASFGLQAARAKYDELRAAIRRIDVDLHKSRLLAPFSGAVAARLLDEGSVVAAGTPIVRLLEGESKEAVVGVPISAASALPIGSEQTLRVGDQEFRSRVSAQIDDVHTRTRTVGIILELPSDARTTDGEVVRLIHHREVEGSGFWVPTTALTQGLRGLWSVYTVRSADDGSFIVRNEIAVLHAETDQAFVRGTLQDGDRIVTTGLHRVVPGQRVQVRETVR